MQLPSPGLFTVLAACFGLSTDTAGASAPAYLGYERTALRSVHGHTNEAACGLIIMSETYNDPAEDEAYFIKVKYSLLEGNEKEVISSDDDFMEKLYIIEQSACDKEIIYNKDQSVDAGTDVDYIFPYSNESYLTYEDIEEWRRFTERLQDPNKINGTYFFKNILRRAINEIYARKGYDFLGTNYTLFNNAEWYKAIPKHEITEGDINKYEKHNIDLLTAIEAECNKIESN